MFDSSTRCQRFRRLAEQRLQRSVKPSSSATSLVRVQERRPNSMRVWPNGEAAVFQTDDASSILATRSTVSQGRSSTAEPRSPKPMMGMQLPPPLPALTRGVMAAQRSLKPSGLGSSPSGSTSFQIIPRWPIRQGSAPLMRSIVVRVHFAEPVFPPGMKTPRTAHSGFAGGATSAKQRSGVACDGCRASMPAV